MGVVGCNFVDLLFLLGFSGSGRFLLGGSSSPVSSDLSLEVADEVLKRVEFSVADSDASSPLVDTAVIPTQMPVLDSVIFELISGGMLVLLLHLSNLEGNLFLVLGNSSLSSESLLSDLSMEDSKSLFTFSKTLLGLLETLGVGVALVGQGHQIVGLDLDLGVFVVLDVVGLLHTDLSLDAVDGDDLVFDLLFFDVDLMLDLVDDLSLVAHLDLVFVQLVFFGADLRLDAVQLVAQTHQVAMMALH